jgi:hypothetical protein
MNNYIRGFKKNSYQLFFILFISHIQTKAQTILFSDDFESYSIGANLDDEGYEVSKKNTYNGTVTATIADDSGNKHIKLTANPNGQAIMKLQKAIPVTPGTPYVFEVYTKGVFKRKLEIILPSNGSTIASSNEFTPTESEKTQWIKQSLGFTPEEGVTSVKIGFFHNWSGTLNIDNIKVYTASFDNNYYMSSSEGNDNNDGSINAPWETISKINSIPLAASDSIFFKKGDRFDGHLEINYSGNTSSPIVITSYGSGDQPIITGEVGAANGGDYQEAIYVENQDNLVFEDIEVHNERLHNRTGISEEDAYGVFIYNSGTEILSNFTFKNVTFKNVYAPKPVLDPDDFNGLEVAALRFETTKNTVVGQEKNIENILMENCYFSDLQRLGVHIKHAGANTGVGNDEINNNKDLIFRNNEFHNLGGTCILPIRTYNCLIEDNIFDRPGDNSDPRMPNRGSSVWTWRCHNTVIQNNQCLHIRGYLDSHGIHIDHENVNTFIQYNYMEDCEGGFVEILGGNVNAVYRFNVSVNDGWRENPGWANSNHTIWINEKIASGDHQSDYNYIYNNTIYIDSPYSTAIDIDGKNTFIYNNIFTAINGADIGGKQVFIKNNSTPLYMRNNLYEGTIKSTFKNLDTNPVYGSSHFYDPNNGSKFGFQLNSNSAAINKGVAKQGPPIPGAGTGVFTHIPAYPNVDFYGNPVDLSTGTPNIGACNAKAGELANTEEILNTNQIMLSPNPVHNYLTITNLKDGTPFSIYNIQGKILVQSLSKKRINIDFLKKGLYLLKVSGHKTFKFIKN